MSRLEAEVSTLSPGQADELGGRRAIRAVSLRLHEVGPASEVDQVRFQPWRPSQEIRDLIQLGEDIARLAAPVRPLEGLVIAVEPIVVPDLIEDDLEVFAGPLEDLPEVGRGRVRAVDLVAYGAAEGLNDQRR